MVRTFGCTSRQGCCSSGLQTDVACFATVFHALSMVNKRKNMPQSRQPVITPEHMRVFVAIGQARTLTEAASSLHIPLFTVSRALKRMEIAAALRLVRRDAKGLELTAVGREYFDACQRVLLAQQEVVDLFAKHRKVPEGTLHISAPHPFVRHVLSGILPDFRKLYPKLKVDIALYCSDWDQAPKASHDVFLKVRTPRDSRHHLTIFPAIRQGLFASPQYLEERSSPSHPMELEQHSCLGQTRDHSAFAWSFVQDGEHLAVAPDFDFVVPDIEVLTQLTLQSFGIAVLPWWLVDADVDAGRLVPILEQWIPEPVTFCALHSGRARMASKEAAFLNFLTAVLGTERDPRCKGKHPAKFFFV